MEFRLAVAALDNAAARRGDLAGCVLHTDRGSLFAPEGFTGRWPVTGWSAPWAALGGAGDNAANELFFGLLRNNVLNRHSWTTRDLPRTPSARAAATEVRERESAFISGMI